MFGCQEEYPRRRNGRGGTQKENRNGVFLNHVADAVYSRVQTSVHMFRHNEKDNVIEFLPIREQSVFMV